MKTAVSWFSFREQDRLALNIFSFAKLVCFCKLQTYISKQMAYMFTTMIPTQMNIIILLLGDIGGCNAERSSGRYKTQDG